MTSDRFDALTRSLSAPTTRRGVLKRLGAAVALGTGVAALFSVTGNAQTQACARLGQTVGGNNGAACCAGLVLDTDGATCKRPLGGTCFADEDCVSGATCQTQTGRMGAHCVAVS